MIKIKNKVPIIEIVDPIVEMMFQAVYASG
jgi:hypothetical protein